MPTVQKGSQGAQAIHEEAIRRYNESADAESDQRDQCVEDIKFANIVGAQWEEWAVEARGSRPKLEINKVALPVNIYLGDFLQNDMAITFRAASGGATAKTASVYKGLSRHILERSGWEAISANAARDQATGGIGAWRVVTQFSSDDTFEQEIAVEMIRSAATSVFYDPSAQRESKQDMKYCFVTELIARKEFQRRWPKASESGVPDPRSTQGKSGQSWRGNWFQPDRIRIAEYWVREEVDRTLLKMSDHDIGTIIEEDSEDVLDDLAAQEPPILPIDSRKVKRFKVVRYLMSGAEFLEGPDDWPGQLIPIIPVFGFNTWIDGTHYYRGIVRLGKDPQRAYNYLSSKRAEDAALAPQDRIWMTKNMAMGNQQSYRQMNTKNEPVMTFTPDEKQPGGPIRLGAPAAQIELASQLIQADQDIQATTGSFSPSLGEETGQSGVAIRTLDRTRDTSTFEIAENFRMGMEVMGRIFAELFPKFFSSPQIVRILGDDAQEEFIPINQEVKDEKTGEMVMLHDLTVGKYDQKVDIGPSFTTKRTEGFEALSAIARDNPSLAPLMIDLLVKDLDFSFAPELEKRVRRPLLQQGIVEPNEEEREALAAQQPQGPTPQDEANAIALDTAELNRDLVRAKIDTEEAEGDEKRASVNETIQDTIGKRLQTLLDSAAAGQRPPITMEELQAEIKNMGLLNESLDESLAGEAEQALAQPPVDQPLQ